ncbi:isomerase [Acrocarpospora corrugata]|uniref:Isomerase n=1 Tax=Acrocarpospora corrugata TaxID=35763 RepID=A0A5M3W579_9ACTN|nr:nuclear transport factor 2 family protein [Acrocarpospora corrugata]GES03192.1 isomerase [Acrocarpospora corrugata]
MSEYTALIEQYVNVWNITDAGLRAKAVAEVWAEDATYTDPLAEVRGHDDIAAVIEGAQAMFPGFVFTRGPVLDAHHDVVRFSWHLGPEGAPEPVVVGFDVAVVADGRITSVYGFLDKVPG